MNTQDLLFAIGDVDDILIKRAKEKQKSHKAVWITIGSMAACLVLCFMLPIVFISMRGAKSAAPESSYINSAEDATTVKVYSTLYLSSDTVKATVQDSETVRRVQAEIAAIIASGEPLDSIESTVSEEVNTESVTIPDSEHRPRVETSQSQSAALKNYVTIVLTHADGTVLRYKLTDSALVDLDTNKEYPLTEDEAESLTSLLGLDNSKS